MSDAMLSVRSLTKKFGDFIAVDDLTFEIEKGEIYALLGPNGAGKTTTIRMILGILRPTHGEVFVDGINVHKHPEIAKAKIGYMPQSHSLYEDLTVWENLDFYASMYGLKDENKLKEILDFVELYDVRHRLVGHLSGGMKQRASLACALVHDPPFLVLDEPTAGVDPVVRRRMWDYFKHLKDGGRTILVTTHYMDEVVHADTIHLVRRGKTMMKGTMDEIIKRMGGQASYVLICVLPSKLAVNRIKKHGVSISLLNAKEKYYRIILHNYEKLESVIKTIIDTGGAVKDINTKLPTLEDAFVYYSQREIGGI